MINATYCGLVAVDEAGKDVPFSVKSVGLDVAVRGWATGTTAKLVYENSLGLDAAEAFFVIPATENIGIYKFEVQNGSTMVANCKSIETASQERDTKQLSADVYRIPIGKLDIGEEITIVVGFVQQLRRRPENGQLMLDFSSVFIPRQLPRWEISSTNVNAVRDKLRQASNHVAVSDVEYQFSINCDINIGLSGAISRVWIDRLAVDSSAIKTDYLADRTCAHLAFTKERFRNSSDLALAIEPSDINLPAIYVEAGPKIAASAWYEPGTTNSSPLSADENLTADGDEYWLILDRSGSMFGAKNEEAKKMLLLFVKSLPMGSKFNVLGFGSTFEALFPDGCVDYAEASAETAVKYATTLKANLGGTSVMGPLNFIYNQKEKPKHCRFIILLTDGQFAESVEGVKRVVSSNAATSRLFTIGIGKDVNRQALEDVARVGSGMSDFIEGVADFQPKVIRLLKAMSNQSLAGFKLDWALNGGVIDKRVPIQLASAYYYGSPMNQHVAITRTAAGDAPVTGTATFTAADRPNHSVQFSIPNQNADTDLVLHRFIAFRQLSELLESSGRSVEAAKLSETSGILCRHTSFVLHHSSTGQTVKGSNGNELASVSSKATGFGGNAVTNKAEIRSGKADEHSVQLAEEVVAPASSFEAISGLQLINGCWKLNEALVKIVALQHLATVDDLRQRVVKSVVSRLKAINPNFVEDDDTFGTLVGLAILRRRFLDRYNQWVIIEKKAHAFLRTKSVDRIDDDPIDLLATRLETEAAPAEEEVPQYSERVDYFAQVDRHALAISRETTQDQFQDLVTRLISSKTLLGTDLEKARSLFIWLSSKDLSKLNFDSVKPGSPEHVLMELKAGRATYAHVYEMLCLRAGLSCVTIEGYVKGIGYRAGMVLDTVTRKREFGGCWNAVKIDGKWRLVNANWAARRVSSDGLQYKLDEFFFLTDPEELIYTHFPNDSQWQLLEEPISLQDFENLPPGKSLFFTAGLKFVGEANEAIIHANNGEVTLQLAFERPETAPFVDFDYALLPADRESDDAVSSAEKLHSCVFHEMTSSGIASFHLRLPRAGNYRFAIFASQQSELFSLADKDARQAYTDICEWKIVGDDAPSLLPYPTCSLSRWGPPNVEVAKLRGFSLIQPTNGALQTDSQGMAEIHFVISAKQEMFFIAKLRAVDSQEFPNEVLATSVVQRRVGDRMIFTVSAPSQGEFGLEIFTNRIDDEEEEVVEKQGEEGDVSRSLFPLCQYLIVNERPVAGPRLPSLPPNYLGPQSSFGKSGLTALSHSDPFITVEDDFPLQVIFGLTEPDQPVKSVANLHRMPGDGTDDEDMTEWVLHQTPLSGDRIAFVCRFPKPGTYKLEIFALANGAIVKSKIIPCVYNYLIDVAPAAITETVLPFPKQYSQWHDGCFLIEPIDGVQKRGVDIPIKLAIAGAAVRRVLAVIGNVSEPLAVTVDGIWEGLVPQGMTAVGDEDATIKDSNKLVVMANFIADPPGSFVGLVEYNLVEVENYV